MDNFSLSYISHYSPTRPLSAAFLAGKRHRNTNLCLKSPADSPQNKPPSSSVSVRRPTFQQKSPKTTTSFPTNPLKSLINPPNTPIPTPTPTLQPHTLSSKLRLSSKLNPPPLPPPPPPLPQPQKDLVFGENNDAHVENLDVERGETQERKSFREPGKIFVGNLPLWIKKKEVAEFFRQFGEIKNVILIKGHHDIEKNMGFGFVIYGGTTVEKAANKAVEFDGVEFHGRVLTVKLDDGNRTNAKMAERVRWVEREGEEGAEFRSKWHQDREGSRKEFQKVLDSQPD